MEIALALALLTSLAFNLKLYRTKRRPIVVKGITAKLAKKD